MFAHISLGVSDFARSLAFYDRVLSALGYTRLFGDEADGFMAYGPEDSFFIINTPLELDHGPVKACNGSHLCLKAPNPHAVDAFYQAALEMGAECAGPAGLRPHYAKDYYAAFVRDPDGHKIEAMARQN